MADSVSCNADDITHKPGWQTTEFYVTGLTAMLPVLTVIFHRDFSTGQVQSWAAISAGIATIGYSISRAYGKQVVVKAQAQTQVATMNAQAAQSRVTDTEALAAVPLDMLAAILAKLEQIAAAEERAASSGGALRPA